MIALLFLIFSVPAQAGAVCGITGDLAARVSNCSTDKTVKKFTWSLVTRDERGQETWLDRASGLVWSDVLDGTYTHFDAIQYGSSYPKQLACGTQLVRIEGLKPWRLPELTEFFEGYGHRYWQILHAPHELIWAATLDGSDRDAAHAVFGNSSPDYGVFHRGKKFFVRCVAGSK